MGSLSIGQVVLAAFPFSDMSSMKLRPCLIVGIAEFNDIIVCQITSQAYSSNQAISLSSDDFIKGTIALNSFIRPDKLATLDIKLVRAVLGTINSDVLHVVKIALATIFEIN